MSITNNLHGIKISQEKIMSYCKKNHIKKLALFGSILREDFHADSDIDILVEFEKDHTPGFFDLIRMQEQLSVLFQGKEVDLRTPDDLSKYFRKKVISNAEVIYEAS